MCRMTLFHQAFGFVALLSAVALGADSAGRVRPPALAGTWYPGDPAALRKAVDEYLQRAPEPEIAGPLLAIVVPHAGYQYSAPVAACAYRAVRPGAFDRVIILAPSHHGAFRGFSIMEVEAFATPLGDVPLDAEACAGLRAHPLHSRQDDAQRMEHSIEIQLPFLQRALRNFMLVPVLVGDLAPGDDVAVADALRPWISARTLIVVSSDFTHYGPRFDYVPFNENVRDNLRKLDMGAVEFIVRKDAAGFASYIGKTGATICGHRPISILLRALPGNAQGKLLQYDTSGNRTGDWSNSVSYVAVAFAAGEAGGSLTAEERKILLSIARTTLNTFAKTGQVPGNFEKMFPITPRLRAPGAVFVTLTKDGALRGCIGRIPFPEIASKLPPLYESVRLMTVESASRDSRFPPVAAAETAQIRISISVLSEPVEINGPDEFRVGEQGIVIRRGAQQAVFLPQVATEQGWDRNQTLSQLCLKAGLPADDWKKPGMKFFVFTAEVFDESLLRDEKGAAEILM